MSSKPFSFNNPNRDIFIVEGEEGPDNEDVMNSMIGDAVQHHVAELTPFQRQCWENFILLGGKNIFVMEPSFASKELDLFNLKTKDLATALNDLKTQYSNNLKPEAFKYIKSGVKLGKPENFILNDKLRIAIEEAIQVEQEERDKGDDVYDNNQGLIPYEDWEQNPQLLKYFDVPSTPPSQARFAGNTENQFYDFFSWQESSKNNGHPDAVVIANFLRLVNQDQDELELQLLEQSNGRKVLSVKAYFTRWVDKQVVKNRTTRPTLLKLVDYIVSDSTQNLQDKLEAGLTWLDNEWAKEWRKKALENQKEQDPLYSLLLTKEAEWETIQKSGTCPFSAVKAIGSLLFTRYRKLMKSHHWSYYRRLKSKFAPRIMVSGETKEEQLDKTIKIIRKPLDLNRCSITELKIYLNLDDIKVRKLWLSRPFENLNQILSKELLDREFLTKDNKTLIYTNMIHSRASEALAKKDIRFFFSVSRPLIDAHRKNVEGFSREEWSMIWENYRVAKTDLSTKLKEKGNG